MNLIVIHFHFLPPWSQNILGTFFEFYEYRLMGEHMVYHGEGSTFAGKENERCSCLVFINVRYSQGS